MSPRLWSWLDTSIPRTAYPMGADTRGCIPGCAPADAQPPPSGTSSASALRRNGPAATAHSTAVTAAMRQYLGAMNLLGRNFKHPSCAQCRAQRSKTTKRQLFVPAVPEHKYHRDPAEQASAHPDCDRHGGVGVA